MGQAKEYECHRGLDRLKVKVLYFASSREIASASAEGIDLPNGSNLGDLARDMFKRHPGLKKLEKSIKFSINFDVAESDAALKDGDEVGVLPPVAGG
jgi:molybdopterin synthase catalytic subunit